MESVDEFAFTIVTSDQVQKFCKGQIDNNAQDVMLDLSQFLERQVHKSHSDYRFNANFVNVYSKSGTSVIQFSGLDYSDFDGCIQYYEEAGIV